MTPPPAQRSTHTARLGRADLLALMAEGLASEAELATRLGYDVDERRRFVDLKFDLGGEANTNAQGPQPPTSTTRATPYRLPLKCPSLFQALPAEVQTPDPASGEEEGSWTLSPPLTDAELDAQLDPIGRAPPRPAALWHRAPQLLALLDEVAHDGLDEAIDWHGVTQRVARRLSVLPWPRQHRRRPAAHWVVLCDVRPDLRVFEPDALDLIGRLVRWRGAQGLEAWRLPHGPRAEWWPMWQGLKRATWSSATQVLVLSDLGRGHPGTRLAWDDALSAWQRQGVRVTVLDPAAPGECQPLGRARHMPWCEHRGIRATNAADLTRLLQALSVAVTVEPALVRALRRALVPLGSPGLEALVWSHTDLVDGLPWRAWRPDRQAAYAEGLNDLDQWSTQDLLTLAKVLQTRHAGVSPAQCDEERLNLAAVLLPRLDGEARTAWADEAAAAAQRTQRLADHLIVATRATSGARVSAPSSDRSTGAEGTAQSATPAAAAYALARAQRSSVAVRDEFGAQAERWQAAALLGAAATGGTLPVTFDWPLDRIERGLQTPAAAEMLAVTLWQVGQRIELRVGTEAVEGAADAGLVLGTLTVPAGLLRVAVDRRIRHVRLDRAMRPFALAEWRDASPSRFELAWPGAQQVIERRDRPWWAPAWEQSSQGTAVRLPAPIQRKLQVPLEQVSSDRFWTYGPIPGRVEFELGTDQFGLYADVPFGWDADRSGTEFNVVSQRFRYIPPTTFLMGSPEGIGHDDEHPQHPVTITQGYWLADTPCTQALWTEVMDGDNPSHFKDGPDAPDRPVELVSWDDVQAFLARLNRLLPPGCVATLPTEAEWELACRAGTTTAYAWGDDFDPANANVDTKGTTPVKRFPPNAWGLYDMHGNVWEWCADPKRTYGASAVVDPQDAAEGGAHRVVRGGSWLDDPDFARSAYRFRWHPGFRNPLLGFRLLLRSPSPASEAGGREGVSGARGAGAPSAGGAGVQSAAGRGAPSAEPTGSNRKSKAQKKKARR